MGMITGGCLCGAVRFEADGPPGMAGYCCCADCRKASGSGFVPFMGMAGGAAFRVRGPLRQFRSLSFRHTESVRNFCAACGGLVFGGEVGIDTSHTIYAGSLDEPAAFVPTIAIFLRDKPAWVLLPDGLQVFDTMPA
jgi:hypothetical protein